MPEALSESYEEAFEDGRAAEAGFPFESEGVRGNNEAGAVGFFSNKKEKRKKNFKIRTIDDLNMNLYCE